MPPSNAQLQELYHRYSPVLLRRCVSILGNEEEAQDAVQETFARVILHWEQFRAEASPLTWMYRIGTNWCLNRIRNRTGQDRLRNRHKDAIAGDEARPGRGEAWESEQTVRKLMGLADEQTRAILVHLFFDDMTREEAAHMVGISVPTLRKRLNAFLASARAAVDPALRAAAEGAVILVWALAGLLLQRATP
jgi:RNA polymerase sigma-70 factor, ECF subfamily